MENEEKELVRKVTDTIRRYFVSRRRRESSNEKKHCRTCRCFSTTKPIAAVSPYRHPAPPSLPVPLRIPPIELNDAPLNENDIAELRDDIIRRLEEEADPQPIVLSDEGSRSSEDVFQIERREEEHLRRGDGSASRTTAATDRPRRQYSHWDDDYVRSIDMSPRSDESAFTNVDSSASVPEATTETLTDRNVTLRSRFGKRPVYRFDEDTSSDEHGTDLPRVRRRRDEGFGSSSRSDGRTNGHALERPSTSRETRDYDYDRRRTDISNTRRLVLENYSDSDSD